jgi:hypothetical protein
LGALALNENHLKGEERQREREFDELLNLYAERKLTPQELLGRAAKAFEKWTTLSVRDYRPPEEVLNVDRSDDEGNDSPISDEDVDWSDDDQVWGDPDTTPRHQAALATLGK